PAVPPRRLGLRGEVRRLAHGRLQGRDCDRAWRQFRDLVPPLPGPGCAARFARQVRGFLAEARAARGRRTMRGADFAFEGSSNLDPIGRIQFHSVFTDEWHAASGDKGVSVGPPAWVFFCWHFGIAESSGVATEGSL